MQASALAHSPAPLASRPVQSLGLTGTQLSRGPRQQVGGRRLSRSCQPLAIGKGKGEAQQLLPSKPASSLPLANAPMMIKVPMVLLAAAATLQVVKAVVKRVSGGGSMSDLEERGFVSDDRKMGNGAMQGGGAASSGAGQLKIEELTDEQIAAARKRRMDERESWRVNIDEIDVPDNHPFAVKQPVSKDEEELMRQRLKVRRGLPLQDLTGKRGFPDEGPPKGSGGPLDPALQAGPQSPSTPEPQARRRQAPAGGGSRSKDLFGNMPPRNENVQKPISQELEGEGSSTQPSETGTQAGREKLRQLMEAGA